MKSRIYSQDYSYKRDNYLTSSIAKSSNYKVDMFSFKDSTPSNNLDLTRYSKLVGTAEEKKPTFLTFSETREANDRVAPKYSQSSNKPVLVKNNSRKLLLLDLDETLVHSSLKPFYPSSDIQCRVSVNHKIHTVYVLVRPGVDDFLRRMSRIYDLGIFTAGTQIYATAVIDKIDKFGLIKTKYYRHHCCESPAGFVKNLTMLGKDLKDVILLDNNPVSYTKQKENGIHIKSWYGNKADKELINYCDLLEKVSTFEDCREGISKIFGKPVFYEPVANKVNHFDFTKKIFSPKLEKNLNSSFDVGRSKLDLSAEYKASSPERTTLDSQASRKNNYFEMKYGEKKENKSFLSNDLRKPEKINMRYEEKESLYGLRSGFINRQSGEFRATGVILHLLSIETNK